MKIKGYSELPKLAKKVIEIVRQGPPDEKGEPTLVKIPITIQAVPLGFDEKLLERCPMPVPKPKFATKNGKVLRDHHGKPVMEPVDLSEAYLRKSRNMRALQSVALLWEGVRHDPDVSFVATPPDEGDEDPKRWQAFYAAIYQELKDAHFTTSEMGDITNEIADLSAKIQQDEIDQERASFS